MEELKLLKVLLQESKYPRFSDDELSMFLTANKKNVYKTASELCILKADDDQEVTVGPIKIKGPGADYWTNLSDKYAVMAKSTGEGSPNSSGYKTRMERADDI